MSALSVKQRRTAAIAEHHPEKLYKRNRGMLSMSREEMHKFASTPERGLPARAGGFEGILKRRGKKKR